MSGSPPVRRELADWLRDAYAGPAAGCPPPEAYLAEELAALAPEERRRLEAHADACPACSAERDLARAFDAGEAGASAADVDWVTARLRGEPVVTTVSTASMDTPAGATATGMPPPGRVVPFRERSAVRTWTRLAAAAVLVVAGGLTLRTFYERPPALPEPPRGGVVRGGEIESLAPLGEVAEPPAELRWQPVAGTAGYRVRLVTVDDTPLWQHETSVAAVRLPPEVRSRLQRAVSYEWTVEALAADGSTVGRSAPARFRVRPLPEETDAAEGTR
ncbi:MAG TPA: zf-HC2 domain-containing protein [Thermoanaerobaculia bacterium]|nr:zf-HC2 domain-containing protein [Thermoanaerobaculia bacterium]